MGGGGGRIRLVHEIAAGQVDSGRLQNPDLPFPILQLLPDGVRHRGVCHFFRQLLFENLPQPLLLPAGIPCQKGLHRQGRQVGPARLQEVPAQPRSQPVELLLQTLDPAGGGPILLQLPGSSDRQVQLGALPAGTLQAVEDRHHGVVVPGGQGIELVVVAAGATQGQAQKDLGGGADDVVQLIESVGFGIGGFIVPGSQAEIPGGDEGLGRGVRQLVSGQLFQDKAVEGFVPVEGPDHVVPVFPGVGLGAVPLVSVAFGVANQVQPVPGPALPICRSRQQIIDGCLVGSLARVLQKSVLLRQVGGQSNQVEIEPPQQLMGFGRG